MHPTTLRIDSASQEGPLESAACDEDTGGGAGPTHIGKVYIF